MNWHVDRKVNKGYSENMLKKYATQTRGSKMVDTGKLNKKIKEKGLKKSFIAQKMGLSRYGFYRKLDNASEFTATEIMIFCDILNIKNLSEKERLFFAKNVEK